MKANVIRDAFEHLRMFLKYVSEEDLNEHVPGIFENANNFYNEHIGELPLYQVEASAYLDTTTEPTEHTRQSAEGDRVQMTDAQVAYEIVMVDRSDLTFVSKQYRARDRILKLSCELWDLRHPKSVMGGVSDDEPHPMAGPSQRNT